MLTVRLLKKKWGIFSIDKKNSGALKRGTSYVFFYERRVWRYKGVIGIRISKKNRQHNGQKKKDKRTNNDLLNTLKC